MKAIFKDTILSYLETADGYNAITQALLHAETNPNMDRYWKDIIKEILETGCQK